jgi:hypothetical protein
LTEIKTVKIYYIDNRKFLEELKQHKAACKTAKKEGHPSPQIGKYIAECIMLMAKRLGSRACFASYSYLDEMIADGIENSIAYGVNSYDPSRPYTPFAYFSRILWSAFIRRIEREQKQHYVKLKRGIRHQLEEQLNDNRYMPPLEDGHTNDDFIRRFEEKTARKKQKRS